MAIFSYINTIYVCLLFTKFWRGQTALLSFPGLLVHLVGQHYQDWKKKWKHWNDHREFVDEGIILALISSHSAIIFTIQKDVQNWSCGDSHHLVVMQFGTSEAVIFGRYNHPKHSNLFLNENELVPPPLSGSLSDCCALKRAQQSHRVVCFRALTPSDSCLSGLGVGYLGNNLPTR